MRLYLDCCCYNRPFDDLSQSRVSYESKAILSIIDEAIQTGVIILGSSILNSEIDNMKDLNKKFKIWALYQAASVFIPLSEEIVELAEKFGLKLLFILMTAFTLPAQNLETRISFSLLMIN